MKKSKGEETIKDKALVSQSLMRFLLFSMVVLGFFSILNYSQGLVTLSLVQASVLLTLPFAYSWIKRGAPHSFVKHLIGFDTMVIFVPLIFVPTIDNTGIYWMFGYPMIVFFFLGVRTGFQWVAIYCITLLIGIELSTQGVLTLYHSPTQIALAFVEVIVFTAIGYYFVTDRERAEKQQENHLHYLQSIDHFEQVVHRDIDFETTVNSALGCLLEIISSHRAWLLYPCDPEAPSWHILYEQTDPDYPGVLISGGKIKSSPENRQLIKEVLSSDYPVHYCTEQPSPLDADVAERFSIKTQLLKALRPDSGKPWLLGLHYCKEDKTCSPEEVRLFQDISTRFEAALNQMLLYRELAESEQNLREAIKQAEAANHAKSEFLSVMSHELRTPLHGIIGLQNIIASNGDGLSAEQRENLSLAQQSAKSLRSLVNDVLDLAKIESGNMDLLHDEFALLDCIRDALVPFILTARNKGISLILNVDNIPETIIGDESRLRQVLLNLVGNAVKFTEHGAITTRVFSNHDRLFFTVEDSGIGIAETDINNIFEPFTQATLSTQVKQRGTGLGTSIVKRFVELMDGSIEVQSTLGRGSVFSFNIPCNQGNETTITHHVDATLQPKLFNKVSPKPPQITGDRSIKALVAEDDPIGQRIAIKQLSRTGIDVVTVDDGELAWNEIQNGNYDLLLTDIRMPGMSGIELTKKIRHLEKKSGRQHLPIIGLSAHAMEEVAKECMDAGMDHFMTKPVDPETILAAVTRNS